MTYNFVLRVSLAMLLSITSVFAKVIHVPADQPTIQAAINVANSGDDVTVAPGTYTENIDFLGKNIALFSSNGASVTTIASNGPGSIVTINKGENYSSFRGFTVKGGLDTHGILVSASSIIMKNIIVGNHSCDGAGILITGGSPYIFANKVIGNFHDRCSGGVGGGGIAIVGAGSAIIMGNVVTNNNGGNGAGGGGISLSAAGTPSIMNNLVSDNTVQTSGGGIYVANHSDAGIVQNVISHNSAPQGSGIYFWVPSGDRGPVLANNTIIAGAGGTQGTAVFASGFDNQVQLYNNLLIALSGQNAVYCDNTFSPTPPTFISNDTFSPSGTGLQGTCSSQSNQNGNLTVDPLFVNPTHGNYQLKGGSPAIDTGANSSPYLTVKDFAGNERIVNGNDGPTAIVDMGALEFMPVVLTPQGLDFGVQPVGSSISKTAKLTNAQDRALTISSYNVPQGYSMSGCGSSLPAFTGCAMTVTFHPLTSGNFNGWVMVNDDAGNYDFQLLKLTATAQ